MRAADSLWWPRPDRAIVAGGTLSFHEGRSTSLPRGLVLGAGRVLRSFDPDDRSARAEVGVKVDDLGDAVVVPGFIDAHNHLPSAVVDANAVRTAHVRSGEDIVTTLSEEVDKLPARAWMLTEHALSLSQFAARDRPVADVLDRVPGGHPIAVRLGAHAMALNTKALELAGIADYVGNPSGGAIERDDLGRPTGIIREYGAVKLVLAHCDPRGTSDDISDAIRTTQLEYARQGITSVRVTGFRPGELAAFHRVLSEDGCLANRVFGGPRLDPTASLEEGLARMESWPAGTGFGGEWLSQDAVKIFVDDGIESVAAGDDPTVIVEPDDLLVLVAKAAHLGWAVTCHAVTRPGIDVALNAYERVRRVSGVRLSIEHGFDVSPEQLIRMASLDVWWSTQPAVLGIELTANATALRSRSLLPLQSAIQLGVNCVLGSDWNAMPGERVRPFPPLESIALAVERRSLWGIDFDESDQPAGEALTPGAAVWLHTRTAALLLGRPDLGLIVPGARADLAILDADPTVTLRPRVQSVIVGGETLR